MTLRLVDGVTEAILRGLEDGDFDLGLSGLRRDNGHLRSEPLMVEDMFFIGPRGHKAAGETSIRLADVVAYPKSARHSPNCIKYEISCSLRHMRSDGRRRS